MQPQTPAQIIRKYRPIATEEAFTTEEIFAAGRRLAAGGGTDPDTGLYRMLDRNEEFRRRLLDLDGERIRVMDEHGVAMQILSVNSPGVQMFATDEAVALAADANDQMAAAIKRHPDRFAGLATIAPQDPIRAAKEAERAMNTLKLNGIIINSHTNGEFLDAPKYRPMLEAIAALDAPLYIHPRAPAPQMIEPFRPGLELAIWGYQADTSLHAMRMILHGVFDDIPKLKIVLGHAGEGLPYWKYRTDRRHAASVFNSRKLQLTPGEYLLRNFVLTTSGMNWDPVLRFCVETVGADNVLWAVDYPFEQTQPAIEGVLTANLSDEEKLKIFSKNSERVFGIAPN